MSEAGPEAFSLVRGGPSFRLERLLAPGPRIAVLVAVSWVPLAIASAFGGLAGLGAFLAELSVHVRFLVAVPLLVAAERVVDGRLARVVQSFTTGGLVAPEHAKAFAAAVGRARRWRDLPWGELGCLLLAFGETAWILVSAREQLVAAWAGAPAPGALSPQAWWFMLVSRPVLRFLVLRWLWRIVVWAVAIYGIAQVPLALNAIHPDRCGGLGFVAEAHAVFAAVVLPIAVTWAAASRDKLQQGLLTAASLQRGAGLLLAEALVIFLGPLIMFTLPLYRARVRAVHEYGALGTRYSNEFAERWMRDPAAGSPLGTPDIQSLADIQGGYEPVRRLRLFPFVPNVVLAIALAVLLPVLVLTGFGLPLDVLVRQAASVIRSL